MNGGIDSWNMLVMTIINCRKKILYRFTRLRLRVAWTRKTNVNKSSLTLSKRLGFDRRIKMVRRVGTTIRLNKETGPIALRFFPYCPFFFFIIAAKCIPNIRPTSSKSRSTKTSRGVAFQSPIRNVQPGQ